MREISQTYYNAQTFCGCQTVLPGHRDPRIELLFDNPLGGYVDYSDRWEAVDHEEWIDSQAIGRSQATIILRNNDNLVQDLRGYSVDTRFGEITAVGYESELVPRLFVHTQNFHSSTSKYYVEINLLGLEDMLDQPCILNTADAPYHYAHYVDMTIFGMMQHILGAGVTLQAPYGIQLYEDYQDDGIINTFMPDFKINDTLFLPNYESGVTSTTSHETYRDVLLRLLWMTKQYMVAENGQRGYKLKFPSVEDPIHETYYSYQQPYFYELIHRENLTNPNNFIVYCDIDPETGLFRNAGQPIGNAKDEEAYALYPKVNQSWAPDITQQYDADLRAQVLLERSQIRNKGGRLITPIDMRVELMDKVKTFDARAG